jgi:hypothetical protein
MTRQLRIVVLSGLFLLFSLAMVHPVRAQTKSLGNPQTTKTRKPAPVMDQMTNIPYFTLRDGMSSTLTLNNLGASPTPVTVTIYNEQGSGQLLKPITLDPHSFKQIELSDVIVGDDFSSGNIEIAFNGISMAVTSQVSVSNLDKRISFESREADMMEFESASLAGIMSLPRGADGFLAVTNTAKNKLTVQLTAGSLKNTIALFPRETRVLKLNDNGESRAATLVRLQHDGLPGDIITTGYVVNLKDGYSSAFTMSDPGILRSSKLAGAHFRAGQPDPSEGFPEGTLFRSPLLLANISAKPVNVHVSVEYSLVDSKQSEGKGDDTQKDSSNVAKYTVAKVKDLAIASEDVQSIELSDALGGVGEIAEAGVDIAYDSAAGSVIGQLTSVDQTGDYSFEVPIKDPADRAQTVESAYPWTTENGTNTVLHLKNTTEQSVNAYVVFIFPDGGGYSPPRIVLEPHQSIAVDIQKLKHTKTPDMLNQIFPVAEGHGLLFWHQETPASMIARAEQTNVKDGIAKSFSCQSGCCDSFDSQGYSLSPASLTGPVGGSGGVQGYETLVSCQNVFYPNSTYPLGYPVSASFWATSAPTVATVSGGNVSYVGGGTAIIDATFRTPNYSYDGFGGSCHMDFYSNDDANAQVTVCVPASVRIIDDISTTVSGTQNVYNNCAGVYENEGSPTWGNTHCYTFQLVDSCGRDITTGNYLAAEHRNPFSMNPNNQSVVNINTSIVNGRWVDWMTYLYTQSPGVPSSWFLKVNQTIHVVNQGTGRDDPVASYCQYYDPHNVYHYIGACT